MEDDKAKLASLGNLIGKLDKNNIFCFFNRKHVKKNNFYSKEDYKTILVNINLHDLLFYFVVQKLK